MQKDTLWVLTDFNGAIGSSIHQPGIGQSMAHGIHLCVFGLAAPGRGQEGIILDPRCQTLDRDRIGLEADRLDQDIKIRFLTDRDEIPPFVFVGQCRAG